MHCFVFTLQVFVVLLQSMYQFSNNGTKAMTFFAGWQDSI